MHLSPKEPSKSLPGLLKPLNLYLCGHEKCAPSHAFGPAVRPHFLIHYIRDGKGTYTVNGKTYHLQAGEGFLIYPGVTTYYKADKKDPWSYYWIGFDGYDVPRILESCGLYEANLVFSDYSEDLSLWQEINALYDLFENHQGNELSCLGQLYRCFSYMHLPMDTTIKATYEAYLNKALEYVHNNYSYEIKISDLAKHLNIDRTYLFKLFKKHLSTSPQQYLIHYRLSISQKLLHETKLTITEIAYSCGFKDASSFDKHFKKHLGITPKEYRLGKLYLDYS